MNRVDGKSSNRQLSPADTGVSNTGVSNAKTEGYEVTFRITSPLQRLLLEKALVMAKELEGVGATAKWGHVFAALEERAVQQGRELMTTALQQATQQQVEAQEK